jgi:hypothetical protein
LNLNIFNNQKAAISNFRYKYLPITMFNSLSADTSITFLLMNTNLRFESPVFNLKIKQLIDLNPNILIYSFGISTSYNYFINFLGNNIINLIKKLSLTGMLLSNHLKYIIFGTYKNNYNFNIIDFVNNIFFNNQVSPLINIIYATINSSSLLLKEVGLSPVSKLISNPARYSFMHNNFMSEVYIKYKNKYALKVFFGHHFAQYVKSYNIIFPIKFFNEKPISYINLEGYMNYVDLTFDYKYSSIKKETDLVDVIGRLFNIDRYHNNFEKLYNKDYLIPSFSKYKTKIAAAHRLLNNFYIKKYDGGGTKFNYIYILNLNSYITDFFLSDIVSRVSSTMSICSKKFTLWNDFIYLYYFKLQ